MIIALSIRIICTQSQKQVTGNSNFHMANFQSYIPIKFVLFPVRLSVPHSRLRSNTKRILRRSQCETDVRNDLEARWPSPKTGSSSSVSQWASGIDHFQLQTNFIGQYSCSRAWAWLTVALYLMKAVACSMILFSHLNKKPFCVSTEKHIKMFDVLQMAHAFRHMDWTALLQ